MRLAVFTKNRLNPAYEGARLGADRLAVRFGATTTHYVPETPDDAAEQSQLIREALQDPPDAFVLVPAQPTGVDEAIQAIVDAGIPLVAFVNRPNQERLVSFVGADDYDLAAGVAYFLYQHMEGAGSVVLVEGPPDSVTSRPRVRAFRDVANQYPEIDLVASCQGAFLQQPAREAVAELLPGLPQVDAFLAANDSMALGVLEALDDAGRSALVGGVNAVPEAVEAVKNGRMVVTADFSAMCMAYVATECAIRHLQGETVPQQLMLPAQVIHAANYEPWNLPFMERGCPDWDTVASSQEPPAPRAP